MAFISDVLIKLSGRKMQVDTSSLELKGGLTE